jgi:hypothetical protein
MEVEVLGQIVILRRHKLFNVEQRAPALLPKSSSMNSSVCWNGVSACVVVKEIFNIPPKF